MTRDYEKAIRRWLPLTYKPKIPGVLNGSITQTIRIDTDLMVGDWIAFHGWTGRPYRSPWSFRTPYLDDIYAEPIIFHDLQIELPERQLRLMDDPRLVDDPRLDELARLDGIQPATGPELIRVIRKMHGPGILQGKILRWDPEPLKDGRPYCFAEPHLQKDENGLICGGNCNHFLACQMVYEKHEQRRVVPASLS